MFAVVVTQPGGPEVLDLQQVPDPDISADEILVDVKATALNRADILQREGRYPPPIWADQSILGLEMAGLVVQIGTRVNTVTVGQKVFGLLSGGGYAQKVALNERMALPMPEGMTFIQAASIPEVFFTAYDALFNQATLKMGESILIHAGGSGVGTAAIQLAVQAGSIAFTTVGSREKAEKAAGLGASTVINYREKDFLEALLEQTDGAGVDVILDVVGAPYWERNLKALSIGGRLILVGSLGGGTLETNLGLLSPKRLRVHGTVLRARPLEEKILLTKQIEKYVLPMLTSGRIKPIVDKVFDFRDAAAAHKYLEENRNFGKVVLSVE